MGEQPVGERVVRLEERVNGMCLDLEDMKEVLSETTLALREHVVRIETEEKLREQRGKRTERIVLVVGGLIAVLELLSTFGTQVMGGVT